jgi:mutator protein MutT
MKQLTLLFLIRDDEVLLAMKRRGFGAGRWNGVGGKLDPDETIEQALVRECQEEIGVTPTIYERAAEIVFHEFDGKEQKDMAVHVYISTAWEGEPEESEEMAPAWFKKGQLPFDEMWPDDPYWLPQVLAGKKLSAEFTLDENDVIINHSVTEQ